MKNYFNLILLLCLLTSLAFTQSPTLPTSANNLIELRLDSLLRHQKITDSLLNKQSRSIVLLNKKSDKLIKRSERLEMDSALEVKAQRLSLLAERLDLLDRYNQYTTDKEQGDFYDQLGDIQFVRTKKPSKNYDSIAKQRITHIDEMIGLLDIDNPNANLNEIRYLVEHIHYFSALYRLADSLAIKKKDKTSSFIAENMEVVFNHYHKMVDDTFHFYTVRDHKRRLITAVEINHGNDFLDVIPMYDGGQTILREDKSGKFFFGNNHDRDMTGAFRMDIYTDFFQLRFNSIFTSFCKKAWNTIARKHHWSRLIADEDPFYTYQHLFVTGFGLTPMLRDTAVFRTVNSFDPQDRPYASYIGIGVSKNRIHRKGVYRSYQEWSIGKIGSGSPYGIQAALHRDLIDASLNPNGWGAQIAGTTSPMRKSGRLGAQYTVRHDLLFVSSNPNITYFNNKWVPKWLNLYFTGQVNFGCNLTGLDLGIGFTNYLFTDQNGSGLVKKDKQWSSKKWRPSIYGAFYFRWVQHNSFLEGFGYTNHMYDGDPFTPKDTHVVAHAYVDRFIKIGNFGISFSRGKSNIYFNWNFTSAEINKYVDGENKYPHYFENDFKYKDQHFFYRRRQTGVNFWGTIGVVFQL